MNVQELWLPAQRILGNMSPAKSLFFNQGPRIEELSTKPFGETKKGPASIVVPHL